MKMPSYETYVKKYMEKANQLAKRGYDMYDQMYTASEYVANYNALREDKIAEIAAGKRKATSNIMRDLVNDQAYRHTKKQAQKLMEAAKQFGYKTNIQKIMAGDPQLTKILREQRQLLKDEGYENREIDLIMSQEYFGSP